MSKQSIDNLMKEALTVADDRWGREGLDQSTQLVTVTTHNLKEAFREAFSSSHRKEFPESHNPLQDPEKVFRQAAKTSFEALKAHLRSKRTAAALHSESQRSIVFTQPRAGRKPFRVLKDAGIAYLNKALLAEGKNTLSDTQVGDINRGLQRLHGNTTVGLARLKKVLDFMEKDELGSRFIHSQHADSLYKKYGDALARLRLDREKGKDIIRYNGEVEILVQKKSKNFAGSEHQDWAKLRPKLEKKITQWLSSKDIQNIPGSKTIAQESTELIQKRFLENLTKPRNITYTGKKPSGKSKPKRGSAKAKGKSPSKAKKVRARSVSQAKKGVSSTPLFLIGVLNEQLPRVLESNMQPPRLQYQTGRFADSVTVTDIIQTPKGYPSIGYTYMKGPYQTFEPGYAQGSVEKDPRRLIDKSIREIAIQYAIGRFYTRRE